MDIFCFTPQGIVYFLFGKYACHVSIRTQLSAAQTATQSQFGDSRQVWDMAYDWLLELTAVTACVIGWHKYWLR